MRLVGSLEEQVVEESRETIDEQMKALVAGTISVVMLPSGSRYKPEVPGGCGIVTTFGPGAGLYIYRADKINPLKIIEASETGYHGMLLGHLQLKSECGWNAWVVCASTPGGIPIQESLVAVGNDNLLAMQKDMMERRHPGAVITLQTPARVVAMRSAE